LVSCGFRVTTDPRATRPQGFVPPKSPLRARSVAASRSPDAPMGFWIEHVPMPAARERWTEDSVLSPAAPTPFRCPTSPERDGEGKVSALSGSEQADEGTDPKVGRPPVGPLVARRLLRFRSAR
jgi:hypothetical protein